MPLPPHTSPHLEDWRIDSTVGLDHGLHVGHDRVDDQVNGVAGVQLDGGFGLEGAVHAGFAVDVGRVFDGAHQRAVAAGGEGNPGDPGDGPGRGWYIDQISLRDVSDLGNSTVQSAGTDLSFRFAPAVSAGR